MSRLNRRELTKLKRPKSKLWLLNNRQINAHSQFDSKLQSPNKSNCKRTLSSKNDDTIHDQVDKVGPPSLQSPADPKRNRRPPKRLPGLHFLKFLGRSLQHLARLDCRGTTRSCSDESSNRSTTYLSFMKHII